MSIRLMTMVFDRYPEGGSEMLLALALADHAHDDGSRIWPSVGELARKTRQSTRTVQRQIQKMVALGWLELVSSATGRRGSTNEYRVTPSWVAGADLAPRGDKLTPHKEVEVIHPVGGDIHTGDRLTPLEEGVRGDTGDAWGDTAMSRRGDTAMSPESSGTINNRHTPLPPGGGATGFDELFAIYPNKINRAKAERRYDRLMPTAAQQQAMRTAIEAQRLSRKWKKDGGAFVPEFATWLRNQGWRDDVSTSQASGAWHESKSGIDAMAKKLGVSAWDEAAFNMGQGPNYIAFTERVMRAAKEAGEVACV